MSLQKLLDQASALTVVQWAAILAAFLANATKIFEASRPFWSRFPEWLQRVAPPATMVAGSLPAALAGVTTWTQFLVVVLGAFALALPSKNPAPKVQVLWVCVLSGAFFAGLGACSRPLALEPCSMTDAEIAAHGAECRARVKAECADLLDSECPVIEECDRWGERRCGQGGDK